MRRARAAAVALALAMLATAGSAAAAPRTAVTCTSVDANPDRVWDAAAEAMADLAAPATSIPFGATNGGSYVRTNAYSWTSGFYPAALWLMYERTASEVWLARARGFTGRVLPVAHWTGTHDLGFMVGLPARLGMRLDPDARKRAEYRVALITAANSLSRRWNSRIGALQSGTYNGRWGLIVDSAMNAPLLIEAGQMLGGRMGRALQRRGTRHMQTLAANLVRADGSTFHRMTFNPRTGARIGPVFGQGLSTASTWARGQAWAMHGFADAFTLTRNPAFLQVAESTADYWLRHVEPGCVPAWDLQVEVSRAPRDSSAAAIAAEALLTLAAAEPDSTRAATYRAAGLATRAALTDPTWVPAATGRGLLQHQSYNVPAVPAEGSYAWGDFYLLSVLAKSG